MSARTMINLICSDQGRDVHVPNRQSVDMLSLTELIEKCNQ